jgi:hypothetical protein
MAGFLPYLAGRPGREEGVLKTCTTTTALTAHIKHGNTEQRARNLEPGVRPGAENKPHTGCRTAKSRDPRSGNMPSTLLESAGLL